ncbi:hypothetical protein BDV26DRAFT_276097 [Aspergillus bertholletiae]|uniref:Uncharacterized protein n=1 Tax=Aspergillus bertholletiae TaxID=1226010 RepID=A0A5N7ANL6_9EURO|nr:hypothetical protein BDV26DRAFT_276097 [Aspergillus bertholletiae]
MLLANRPRKKKKSGDSEGRIWLQTGKIRVNIGNPGGGKDDAIDIWTGFLNREENPGILHHTPSSKENGLLHRRTI